MLSPVLFAATLLSQSQGKSLAYPVAGTGQRICTDEERIISPP